MHIPNYDNEFDIIKNTIPDKNRDGFLRFFNFEIENLFKMVIVRESFVRFIFF